MRSIRKRFKHQAIYDICVHVYPPFSWITTRLHHNVTCLSTFGHTYLKYRPSVNHQETSYLWTIWVWWACWTVMTSSAAAVIFDVLGLVLFLSRSEISTFSLVCKTSMKKTSHCQSRMDSSSTVNHNHLLQ